MCPDYPVVSYTVSVGIKGSTENITTLTSDVTNVSTFTLLQDSRYVYTLVLANEFGNSSRSAPVEISK